MEGGGNAPSLRSLKIYFGYAVDSGGDKQAAISDTTSVEVCWTSTFDNPPSHIICPWSHFGSSEFLIYDVAKKPAAAPKLSAVGIDGKTTLHQAFNLEAIDWKNESNKGRILFIRTKSASSTGKVPAYPEFKDIIIRDGFCPLPHPLVDHPRFPAFGVSKDEYSGYDNPLHGLVVGDPIDPCTDGNKAGKGVVQPKGHVCMDPALVAYIQARLEEIDSWQRVYLESNLFNEPTWSHGSGGDCSGEGGRCPTNLLFHPTKIFTGGSYWGDHITLPPAGKWELDYSGPLGENVAFPLAVLGHEYFHEFSAAWTRANGGAKTVHYPPYGESLTDAVARSFSLPHPTTPLTRSSAHRIYRLDRAGPNVYLNKPAQSMLHNGGRADLFWRYAMEQYGVKRNPGNPAHPGGTDAAMELRWTPGEFPVGARQRRPDEGSDIVVEILKAYAQSPNEPTVKRTGIGIENALGRDLETMVLDFHTAMVLKDYRDRPDFVQDPRWRFEWIGSFTVGGDKNGNDKFWFPDNFPPPVGDSIAEQKNLPANFGRLPPLYKADSVSPYDDLVRAKRHLDSYDFASHSRIELMKGETIGSGNQFTTLQPWGAAVLSVHPDPTEGLKYFTRVRIGAFAVKGYEAPNVRVFRINQSGKVSLTGGCDDQDPTSDASVTEHCDYSGLTLTQGKWLLAMDELVEVKNGKGPIDGGKRLTDELIVVISAGDKPAAFRWTIGESNPYVEIISPTTSKSAQIGHGGNPASSSKPFLLKFTVSDKNNQPLMVDRELIKVDIPDCSVGSPELAAKPSASSGAGDYYVHRFKPGLYMAVVTVPDRCYPVYGPYTKSGWRSLKVSVGGIGADLEQYALRFTSDPPKVALQLVLDASGSMGAKGGSKLLAAKMTGELLIQALGQQDAVGVVSFGSNARHEFDLRTICELANVRKLAIDALWNVTADGCTSIGDGLFQAQAAFAVSADVESQYWDVDYASCKPSRHAMVLLSDGMNATAYDPAAYYEAAGFMEPKDGVDGGSCASPWDKDLPYGGWLRYKDRRTFGLKLPEISAIALGQDADLAALQKLLDSTSQEPLTYIEGPDDESNAEKWRMTAEMADQFRQGANAAAELDRVAAWYPKSVFPHDMPVLDVEPMTEELIVSVASARDDTSVLQLVDPDGDVFDPVGSRSYATVFRIATPQVGTWSWQHVRTITPPTSAEPAVFVEQAVRGPVRLFAMADVLERWLIDDFGEASDDGRVAHRFAFIRAMPSDGQAVLGAAVSAEVMDPDGQTTTVQLADDGLHADDMANDGVYGAFLEDTTLAGTYQVAIQLSGTSSVTGAPFQRQKKLALHLREGNDSDDDGLPDWFETRYANSTTILEPAGDDDQDGLPI